MLGGRVARSQSGGSLRSRDGEISADSYEVHRSASRIYFATTLTNLGVCLRLQYRFQPSSSFDPSE